MRHSVVLSILLSTCLSSPVVSAPAGTPDPVASGSLRGVVRTRAGEPLPGIVVSLSGPQSRTLVTGPGGRYEAEQLPAGAYRLE
ncbi:MAG TPA: carboxypeptidase-like regulatory domain-containing protein, partial [Vicinamibacteria bacterium]